MERASWKKTCPLDFDQVTKAVKALKEYTSKTRDKNQGLLEEHNVIQIQILFHRIPTVKNKTVYIDIPHSLYPQGTEICMITRDTGGNDAEKTVEKWQKIFSKRGVDRITKIMPLRELKLDYGSFDAKRRLLTMYDLFLCEDMIAHRMQGLLGKTFIGCKKHPWPVKIYGNYVKDDLDEVLNQTRWITTGNGSCSLVTAAKTNFSLEQIVENIMACAVGIARFTPRGWNNVRALHIRTDNSIALPVYYNDCPVNIADLDFTELRFLRRQNEISVNKQRILNLIGSKKINRKRPKFGYKMRGARAKMVAGKKSSEDGDDL